MGKYDGYLLCTDFDGTFALPGTRLSEENLAAVKRFQKGGGLFTIASGRQPQFIRELVKSFEVNAPVIAMNGTMVCDERSFRIIRDYPMEGDVLGLLDEVAALNLCDHITLWNDQEARDMWHRDSGLTPGQYYANHPKPWYKAVMVCPDERSALAMRAWFNEKGLPGYVGSRSWPSGFEIQGAEGSKGAALQWIRRYLGDRIHTTIGVGDFENDISLICAADIGYAVGNAIDEVKAAADRVTVSNDRHAIAAIIDELG